LKSCVLHTLTFVNISSFFPSTSRDGLLIRFHSRNSGCERVPSAPFPPSPQATHSGSSSHLYLTPNGLDCSSRIFAVVKLEMSTITGLSLLRLGELKAETRICPEEFSDRERGPVVIVSVSDKVSLVGSLQVSRLHRTHIVLVMRCVANKRARPVDLESGIAGGQRNTSYSLSTAIVIFLI
jgi:hypothetical protein